MSSCSEEIASVIEMQQRRIVAEICKLHPPQSVTHALSIRVTSEIIEALPGEVEEAPSD